MPQDCNYHLNRLQLSHSGNLSLNFWPPLPSLVKSTTKKMNSGAQCTELGLDFQIGVKKGRDFLYLDSRRCLFRLSPNKGTIALWEYFPKELMGGRNTNIDIDVYF